MLIRLTDAATLQADSPLYVDPAQIAVLQVNRSNPNLGTIITLSSAGGTFAVLDAIEDVVKAIKAAAAG